MIVEWILNLLVALLKAPISLLHLPDIEYTSALSLVSSFVRSGYSFIRFLFDDLAMIVIGVALGAIILFKVADIVGTIIGFFKKTG